MKRYLVIFFAGLIMFACATSNKQIIRTKDLKGRYDVDVSSFLAALDDDDEDKFVAALASLFLSNIDMTLQFEETKLIFDVSGALVNFANTLAKDGIEMPVVMDYKIVNDSVLYTKPESGDFKEIGVLRKVGNTYDYLQLVTAKDSDSPIVIKLKRQLNK